MYICPCLTVPSSCPRPEKWSTRGCLVFATNFDSDCLPQSFPRFCFFRSSIRSPILLIHSVRAIFG